MKNDQYNRIFQFISQQIIPSDLTTNKQIKQFRNFCAPFIVKNNYLYRKDKRKTGNLLRVIRTFETEAVLYMTHNSPTSGHFATDIMFDKIRSRYFWPQMYESIREYVRSCDACQRRGKTKTQQELHPIPVYAPFYRIGINFVRPLPKTDDGNWYIRTPDISKTTHKCDLEQIDPFQRVKKSVFCDFLAIQKSNFDKLFFIL